MKNQRLKIVLLTLLIITSVLYATAQDKRFTAYTFLDAIATTKDGFNVGFGLEYQMTVIYIKTQAFLFPGLRGKDYAEYTGAVGFNYHSFWNTYRVFAGLKAGTIKRDSLPHATYGLEIGLEYYPNKLLQGIYIGVQLSRDRRTDGKVWDKNLPPYWRNSGFIKLGYCF